MNISAKPLVITYTVDQLRAIYDRVEEIERHAVDCCGNCRFNAEYDDLTQRLASQTDNGSTFLTSEPFDRETFEEWLATRDSANASTSVS